MQTFKYITIGFGDSKNPNFNSLCQNIFFRQLKKINIVDRDKNVDELTNKLIHQLKKGKLAFSNLNLSSKQYDELALRAFYDDLITIEDYATINLFANFYSAMASKYISIEYQNILNEEETDFSDRIKKYSIEKYLNCSIEDIKSLGENQRFLILFHFPNLNKINLSEKDRNLLRWFNSQSIPFFQDESNENYIFPYFHINVHYKRLESFGHLPEVDFRFGISFKSDILKSGLAGKRIWSLPYLAQTRQFNFTKNYMM